MMKIASRATYSIPPTGPIKELAYSKIYINFRPISEDIAILLGSLRVGL
jgi:hypothetical protein